MGEIQEKRIYRNVKIKAPVEKGRSFLYFVNLLAWSDANMAKEKMDTEREEPTCRYAFKQRNNRTNIQHLSSRKAGKNNRPLRAAKEACSELSVSLRCQQASACCDTKKH